MARAWVDGDGDVLVGTSLMCARRVTEGYMVEQVEAWHQAALELLNKRPGAPRQDGVDDGDDGERAGDGPDGERAAGVSEDGPAPRRKRATEVVH